MNYYYRKMVSEYCSWMDEQIGSSFPLTEREWEQVANALEKIVYKFPKSIQPEVQERLFEVYRKWDVKEMQMMKANSVHA